MMIKIFKRGAEMSASWERKVKCLLKSELKKRDLTYLQLSEKLVTVGIIETPENIANKISRGRFSAIFLIQCLEVIGCNTLRLEI
jgi:hypothetical protein